MSQRGRDRADRGSLTLMLAVLFVALLGLAGIVIDGGAKLTAAENAAAIAQEAARAGAGQVNQATAHENGSFVVDENQAIAAANDLPGQRGRQRHRPGRARPERHRRDRGHRARSPCRPRCCRSSGSTPSPPPATATANLVSGVTGPGQ